MSFYKRQYLFRPIRNRGSNKKELSYKFQRHSGISSIVGAYASIILTIIIFIYTCNTSTKVEGMQDLIQKQNSVISHLTQGEILQRSAIDTLTSIVDTLKTAIIQLKIQNDLTRSEVDKLEFLAFNAEAQLGAIRLQNANTIGVLKGINGTVKLLTAQQMIQTTKSFYKLHENLKDLPDFDPAHWGGLSIIHNVGLQQEFLEYSGSILYTLDLGKDNDYLLLDTAMKRRWDDLHKLVKGIVFAIEAKPGEPSMPESLYNTLKTSTLLENFHQFLVTYRRFKSDFKYNLLN
jgi:hypothetical protein